MLTDTAVNPADSLKKQYRFGYTVRNKTVANQKLVAAIDSHLAMYGIQLPDDRNEYNKLRPMVYDYEAYGDALESKFHDLAAMRYALGQSKGYYARFTDEAGNVRLNPLAFWYSKHRLCHVWNWRKSQIIRNKYFHYLKNSTNNGYGIADYYHPCHLVLTVPHPGGLWNGKQFYAKELIAAFTKLRKREAWKKHIWAGEYGVEIKRAASGKGLHIHIHSLVLQEPKFKVDNVRAAIETEWREITGNSSGYSGIHYETLYTWKRNDDGSQAFHRKRFKNEETGKFEFREVPVKEYVTPGKSDLTHYMAGVMECIKYHFKPDALETVTTLEGGKSYDIPLILNILENTKNLRMYSRFGAFYRVQALNFNNLETEEPEPTEWIDEETGEVELGKADTAEANVINPFTLQPAARDEYAIVIGSPTSLRYHHRTSEFPHQPFAYDLSVFRWAPPMPLKEIIRLDLTNQLTKVIEQWVSRQALSSFEYA